MCASAFYKSFCIFFLILPIVNTLSSAVCFLTKRPASSTIKFALQLAQNVTSIDVFIIVDDNTIKTREIPSSTVKILQFNETVCTKYGFQESNVFGSGKTCSAWDKALYYFSRQNIQHSFVWFIEEDVFIPSTQAFLSLHKLYSSTYDLISNEVELNTQGHLNNWPHWHYAFPKFYLPWAHGMVCTVGCSRRLLSSINELVQWRGQLAFIEILFHTLAIQDHRMKIVTPFELNTIVYRDTYLFEQIEARPNNWWHPMKDLEQQDEWRNILATKPVIDKNKFVVTLTSVEKYLSTNTNMKFEWDIASQMLLLLTEFRILKGQLKPSIRLQLRKRFLGLLTNRSHELKAVIGHLADHAFKLPYPIIDINLQQNKTETRMKLEKALENNKQMVLKLIKNSTTDEIRRINLLRDEAKYITLEITNEIQCEQKNFLCIPKRRKFKLHDEYSQENFTMQMFLISTCMLCAIFICLKLKMKIRKY